MNDQELISHIEELGLSNKEARVYVAALQVGPSPVQRIADQSGIKRVTTYVILESLVGLGLVSQSVKGKKTYFIAEDPGNLKRLIEKREHELKEQKANFTHILPELVGLKSVPKEMPNVKYYDSADGISTIQGSFMENAKKAGADYIYGFSNVDEFYTYFPDFFPDRLRVGIPSRFLYTSSKGAYLKEADVERNRESRWLPLDKFPVSGDFLIAGDTIAMLSFGGSNPMGVTVASKEIAQGLRALFQVAWEAAEIYNK